MPSPPPSDTPEVPAWLPLAAVGVTLVLWASAFVGIRHLAGTFSPGALSLGRLVFGAVALGVALLVSRSWRAPTRARVARDGRGRGALVRHLQRGPQRRRAPDRRRHGGDADPGLADPGGGAGAVPAAREADRVPRGGHRAGVQRRRADRAVELDRQQPRRARSGPLPPLRGRLRDQPGPPEAAGRPAPGAAGDVGGVHGRRRGLPPVRRAARGRDRGRVARRRRLARLPGRVPHRDRVHDVRVRVAPHDRQQPERDDVPRPADHGPAQLGVPLGDSARGGVRRRRDVPGRRRRGPAQDAAPRDRGAAVEEKVTA